MQTLVKTVWTTIAIGALAWPLLFWGKPASPGDRPNNPQSIYNALERHDLLW